MMTVSQRGIELIKQFEGFRVNAYLDQVGVPTIGYGTIRYMSGQRVKMGDKIDQNRAEDELRHHVKERIPMINAAVKSCLNQNQYDSIVSFVYNLGIGAFRSSTLLRKININPDDPTIRDEFMKWNKGRINGVLTPLPGLTARRRTESNLYFLPIN